MRADRRHPARIEWTINVPVIVTIFLAFWAWSARIESRLTALETRIMALDTAPALALRSRMP